MLVLLADGVSASQFPKQASRIAVETVAEAVVNQISELTNSLSRQSRPQSDIQTDIQTDINEHQNGMTKAAEALSGALPTSLNYMSFNDEQVAGMIKIAVNKANDAMYFSQSYERVPPLLSTLSGLLCIGDRIHLFHTGDSRIYRLGVDEMTVISRDHRITKGQDKGALSAALGADNRVHLQQDVFTLHQNEYLAIMTDGVYEFINATEMQYEVSQELAKLEAVLDEGRHSNDFLVIDSKRLDSHIQHWRLSQKLCELAYEAGSNDNLSMITLGMSAVSSRTTSKPSSQPFHYKLPTGLEVGDVIDGFEIKDIIARTVRSDVYLVVDKAGHEYVLKSPSMNTVDDGNYIKDFLKERKIGLSLSKNRRAGESSFNQTNPNQPVIRNIHQKELNKGQSSSAISDSGLLRYYPVPASSHYLYHLTEFIEGESLRAFIERHGTCDVWQTHDLLTKIGMAARVMHRNYLIHQDIKPENVLLTKNGAVKLIDFGSTSSSILKDSTRPPVGDLHYAAPEYYTDAPKGVHSDLFSIAVIGFELLTGNLPFTSQALMSPNNALTVPTELLHQQKVPFSSQQALLRALHRNTNVRYQAIGEFLQEFNPDNMASNNDPEPLIKRNPLLVWHGICLLQGMVILFLLYQLL